MTSIDYMIQKFNLKEFDHIAPNRIKLLNELATLITNKLALNKLLNINFVCTHNSRRSQFSQVWATVASTVYDLPINCYSSGTEVTAVHRNVIDSLKRFGFEIETTRDQNVLIKVYFQEKMDPILLYSKKWDDASLPVTNTFAIMTCSEADVDCPVIPGTELRFSLPFNDPKIADNTSQEAEVYDAKSKEIASELFYLMSRIARCKNQ